VIGVQDEQQIQRLGRHRIELQRLGRHFEHHVQEAIDIVEIVARVTPRPADRMAVTRGRDGRHLGQQSDRRHPPLLGIVQIQVVVIERRQRTEHAAQHRHRMGIMTEALQEALERLVHHRVMGNGVIERIELGGCRQLAIDQQIRHFGEIGVLGQLFDRVAAVQQHAGIAIDVRHRTFAAGGRGEARVVGEVTQVFGYLADIQTGRAQGAAQDRQFRGFAGNGIGQGEALGIGHNGLLDRRFQGTALTDQRPGHGFHAANRNGTRQDPRIAPLSHAALSERRNPHQLRRQTGARGCRAITR